MEWDGIIPSMADKKILLVEDSESLRKVMAEKLRDEGFTVVEASGGEDGVKIAMEHKPDVIITDIVMFPVDGLEMAKRIRDSGPWGHGVNIIALTNQNSSEDEKRVSALDLYAYLVKSDTGLDQVVRLVKEVFVAKKG